ncbi:conserved exported hypothetical protein [Burkholderiales bacterium 8X]|nr:conserved exported hypothetical protein [Burkholderiales bacterium 8X]
MTRFLFGRRLWRLLLPILVLSGAAALAAPGAHGPNGEHLDAPVQKAAAGATAPRFEAKSESFELVATLRGDELSMFINRFETGEPVLDARIEVESGGLKAPATFRSELGNYTVAEAAFLKALSAPGEHAIVITILAGADSDLLDGTLKTGAAGADAHGHAPNDGGDHGRRLPLTAWLAIALAAIAGLAWLLRRKKAGARASAVTGAAP